MAISPPSKKEHSHHAHTKAHGHGKSSDTKGIEQSTRKEAVKAGLEDPSFVTVSAQASASSAATGQSHRAQRQNTGYSEESGLDATLSAKELQSLLNPSSAKKP